MSLTLPFDYVEITEDGETRQLQVEEFVLVPLVERVRHLLSKSLKFRRGDDVIDPLEALSALRSTAASPGSKADG